jgi:transketolase
VKDVVTQLDDLRAAVAAAKAETSKPSIIACKTLIGYGSPSKQGSHDAHGAPLGAADLAGAKEAYGLPKDKMFYVAPDVQQVFNEASAKGEKALEEWQTIFDQYQAEFPSKAQEIQRRFAGKLPEGLFDSLPKFVIGQDKDLATRQFSQLCINAIAPKLPEFVGGSADLTPSNLTRPKSCTVDYQKDTPQGKYFRFGIREHGMAAICNGIFAYGGMRPYCATFLTFAGYCMGSIRLSALSKFGVIYVFTHDSIGLGEDGPTHQPVEQLEQLRSMPNINVFRPADSNEMSAAYQCALECHDTPTVIAASRSGVKALFGSSIEKATKGGYIAVDVEEPQLILVSTGLEVGFCVTAAEELTAAGVATRVVSMPCQEIFLQQSADYQASVLPGNIPTLSVEASSPHGWHRFSHAQIAMESFGASGPGGAVYKYFGFSPENIVAKGKAMLEFYKDKEVPNLRNVPHFAPLHTSH